jgi:hypothetical protein
LVLVGQVRRLRAEVAGLARHDGRPPSSDPVSPAADLVAERGNEVVIRPTPLGPADVEPDPSVSRVASVTLSGSMIKVAAFSSGVRRALGEESRMRVAHAFRRELRRQRRLRRKQAGWRP